MNEKYKLKEVYTKDELKELEDNANKIAAIKNNSKELEVALISVLLAEEYDCIPNLTDVSDSTIRNLVEANDKTVSEYNMSSLVDACQYEGTNHTEALNMLKDAAEKMIKTLNT